VVIFNLNATWGIEKVHPWDARESGKTYKDNPVLIDGIKFRIPPKTSNKDPVDIDDERCHALEIIHRSAFSSMLSALLLTLQQM